MKKINCRTIALFPLDQNKMIFSLCYFIFSTSKTIDENEELIEFSEVKQFSMISQNEIANGIISELLINCKLDNFKSLKCQENDVAFNESDFSYLFIVPTLFFTLFGYFVAILIILINKIAIDTPFDKQETIPVKIFCMKSFMLPEVETLPQTFNIDHESMSKPWNRIINEKVEKKIDFPEYEYDKNPEPPGSDIVYFDSVNVRSADIVFKPLRSLYSYENWY